MTREPRDRMATVVTSIQGSSDARPRSAVLATQGSLAGGARPAHRVSVEDRTTAGTLVVVRRDLLGGDGHDEQPSARTTPPEPQLSCHTRWRETRPVNPCPALAGRLWRAVGLEGANVDGIDRSHGHALKCAGLFTVGP